MFMEVFNYKIHKIFSRRQNNYYLPVLLAYKPNKPNFKTRETNLDLLEFTFYRSITYIPWQLLNYKLKCQLVTLIETFFIY